MLWTCWSCWLYVVLICSEKVDIKFWEQKAFSEWLLLYITGNLGMSLRYRVTMHLSFPLLTQLRESCKPLMAFRRADMFIYAALKVKCLRIHSFSTVISKYFPLSIRKADSSCQVDIRERCSLGMPWFCISWVTY